MLLQGGETDYHIIIIKPNHHKTFMMIRHHQKRFMSARIPVDPQEDPNQ